jgi:hypothetical protein
MLENGEWLQFLKLWDYIQLQHVKVDTPCERSHKEKCAYHHNMHNHTPQFALDHYKCGIAPCILNVGTRWEVSSQLQATAALSPIPTEKKDG